MATSPAKPLVLYEPVPTHVLDLDTLPPRIVRMVQAIIDHQQVLTAYETGQLSLNWNGPYVRPQLEKVCLNSDRPPT